MLITIFNSEGKAKIELSPNDSSTAVDEIQGDSILTLSFNHFDHIELEVDDYADFEGKRYWLLEKYRPKQNARQEWTYDLKLYGVESLLKRLLVIKSVDGEEDPVFTLTAPPHEHVAMIVECLNRGMGNVTSWKVGQVNGLENIVIDYFGKYCDEALKEIAEKVNAEWWVDGQTVNVCKCEHGEPVTLGYGKGLLSIDPGTADNVKFYTRLYPVGSSRNIDRESYGFSRLQLPGGMKFVEMNAEKYGRVDHFEQTAFEDIYPRRIGIVSQVRIEEKTGEDGNPFTIYYFKDKDLPFDPDDYMIGGLVLRVSFQEGSELAGLGDEDNGTYYFEVNWHKESQEFEIITIWPYDNGIQLPGDRLIPKAGDKYILWNLRMPEEYYRLAEEEFLEAVNRYNDDHNLDISVYKAPTDHVWIEQNKVSLSIGRRIRLESEEYFPGIGFRESRITKITRKVNLPSYMDIEIGDALSKTSQEKMTDAIDDVRNYAKSIGESTSLPDIIRTGDKTPITDNNLMSALRILYEITQRALSRIGDDEASGLIKFLKGAEFGDFIGGFRGARIDEDGKAELHELLVNFESVFRGNLSSEDFISGFLGGKGWAIFRTEVLNALGVPEAKYTAEFDNLIVRGALRIYEMIVSQLVGENDNRVFSAMLKVDHYDPSSGRIYLDTEGGRLFNPFRKGDYVMVEQYNGTPSDHNDNYVTKQYEFIVTDAGVGEETGDDRLDWISFSSFQSASGSSPETLITKGDTLVRVDNDTDPNRKGLIQVITVGNKAPYLDVLYGLKTDPENALKGRLGNLEGIRHHLFGWLQGFGEYLTNLYAIGDFRLKRTGESLDSQIEMLKGLFASRYNSLTYELTEEENYLFNASFSEMMKGWEKDDEGKIITSNGEAFLMNVNTYLSDGRRANLELRDGRMCLFLKDSGIRQENELIRKPGTHKEYVDDPLAIVDRYIEVNDTLYLSIRCLVKKSGTLRIGFADSASEPGSLPAPASVYIDASEKIQTFEWSGTWDGKGDFILEFSGEMYVLQLSLTDRALEEFRLEMETKIEQTDSNIKLTGKKIDSAEDSITQLGIELDARLGEIDLYVNEQIGTIKDAIGQIESGLVAQIEESGLQIRADMARLYATKESLSEAEDGLRQEIESSGLEIRSDIAKLYVTRTTVEELTGRIEEAEAAIIVNAEGILQTVKKDGIISAINQSAESVTIQAEKISLEGAVTINNSFKIDETGTVYMQNGAHIAGLIVQGNGLTNEGFDNDAYIIFRNDPHGIFVGIGCNVLPGTLGYRGVARFENHDTADWWGIGANYAMLVSAQGARTNVALQFNGGYVSGLAMQTSLVSSSKSIGRLEYNIVCINTSDITLTLPSMQLHDDGHVIRFKRLGSGKVDIGLTNCYTFESVNSTRYSRPVLLYNAGDLLTGSNKLTIASVMDSFELVWCRDLVYTHEGVTSYGAWIQYKLPRDW